MGVDAWLFLGRAPAPGIGQQHPAWSSWIRSSLNTLERYLYSLYLVHFLEIVFCKYVSFEGIRLDHADQGFGIGCGADRFSKSCFPSFR